MKQTNKNDKCVTVCIAKVNFTPFHSSHKLGLNEGDGFVIYNWNVNYCDSVTFIKF